MYYIRFSMKIKFLFFSSIKNTFFHFLGFIGSILNVIPKTLQVVIKYVIYGVMACFIALPIITSIIQYDRMSSGSMLNSLEKGNAIFTAKLYYGVTIKPFVSKITGQTITFRQPKRGDVVLIRYPLGSEVSFIENFVSYALYFFSFGNIDRYKEGYIVKRIIALPSETIEVRDKTIYINGIPLTEKWGCLYTDDRVLDRIISSRDNVRAEVVPYNKYFVLSDNRDYSYDSRNFGFIDIDDIKGRVLGVE